MLTMGNSREYQGGKQNIFQQDVFKIIFILIVQIQFEASGVTLYVSKARGHDPANSCQNMTSPCKTLNRVINMTKGNDVIMLDGNDTETMPYDTCPQKSITIPLNFQSWYGTPIINCSGLGLNFQETVEIRGLKFLDTFLRIHDHSLKIDSCSFRNLMSNTTFEYLINVQVSDSLENLRINITNTNFLEKNNAGAISVVSNRQAPSVFVEIRNITVGYNLLKEGNFVISIQGYVNLNFIDSVIFNTIDSTNASTPLINYSGCLKEEEMNNWSSKTNWNNSLKERKNFDQNLSTLKFSLVGINFSSNQARIVQAVFCSTVDASFANMTVSNHRMLRDGIVMTAKLGTLDARFFNCSFTSNQNELGGGMITVSSHSLALSVAKCNFFSNGAGAVYAKTSPSGVVAIRNSFIVFGKSKGSAESFCGAQICVMFNSSNDAWINSSSLSGTSFETEDEGVPLTGTDLGGHTHVSHRTEESSNGVPAVLRKNGVKDAFTFWPDYKDLEWVKNGHEPRPGNSLNLPSLPHPGLTVEDCQFHNNTSSDTSSAVIEVHSSSEPQVTVANLNVQRSVFKGNLASNGNGAIYTVENIGCNISDSIFVENNGGQGAGAIEFRGTTMFLFNCTLDSNNGGSIEKTQAIGSVRLSNMGKAFLLNSRIIQRRSVSSVRKKEYHGTLGISSDIFEELVLSNSTLDMRWSPYQEKVIVLEIGHTKNFVLDNDTSIICPSGYSIKHTTKLWISQSFECNLCTMGSYSVQRGVYRNNAANMVDCLPCPYGGKCRRGLEALPNFWGYKVQDIPPTIHFSRCPRGYCCQGSAMEGCVPYDTCNSNRHGRLCGQCMPGYTEDLFTPLCRRSEDCSDYWFWPMAVAFVLGFTLYLIVQPDISGILRRSITWFRPSKPQVFDGVEDHRSHHNQDVQDTIQPLILPADQTIVYETSGAERIVFFYYQATDILSAQGAHNTIWEHHLNQFILGFFNFDIRLNRDGFACPFQGLTPVSKLLFHTLGVFSVLFAIPCLFIFHKAISMCLPVRSPTNGVYLSAFLKAVFLGYTVLARKCLTLLKCVTVDGVNCLFVNCTIECYTWWQTLIGTLVLIYFFPFVFVIFFGAKKMYKKQISVLHFFIACLFPLPVLSYWLINRRHLDGQIAMETGRGQVAVTSVLIGLYRVPDHVSAGAVYWESVLIGRMLVLILAGVLIKDPFLSSLAMLLMCVINLALHIHIRPFERVLDNRAEAISLFALILIAMFNLPFAAYLSEGVVPTGPMSRVMDVFMWCRVVLIGFLPLICVLLLLIAVLSQAARIVFLLGKGVRSACVFCGVCCAKRAPNNELGDPLIE
ncbi:uncharacterized protein LOC114533314 [Dendronephthya gigantea]|uniref:uncharacterized protein LOC114533314 n=1 Tax=Dendronephthya gigantea TaxID=151771 RepID=UPI00106BAD83|nr:uncharacterized protein LOC114533314 [Dendronephthya gigantea]